MNGFSLLSDLRSRLAGLSRRRWLTAVMVGWLVLSADGPGLWPQPPVDPPRVIYTRPAPCDEKPAPEEAQAPDGPPPHEHAWDDDDPQYQGHYQLQAGAVTLNPDGPPAEEGDYYIRCGETVRIGPGTPTDTDHCRNEGCPFGNGEAVNNVSPVDWRDGGAEGEFGHLEGTQFEVGAPVTHYKAPMTAQVVALTVKTDDIPRDVEPGTNPPVEVDTFDDPARWQEIPTKITVWEFTISDGAAGFRPERPTPPGVQRTFTATIDPATDHNQESLARTLMFLIGSSQEPGYCLNMTWEHDPPEWNDTSAQDPDLKFPSPDPNGVTVTSYRDGQCRDVATTTEPRRTWTVPVACLDYGAYGCVVACAWLPGGGGPHLARLRLGEQNPDGSYNYKKDNAGNYWELAPLPWDENTETGTFGENCIWDGWAHDGDTPGNQTTDLENVGQCVVSGEAKRGDGFSRYEEYRGFSVNGDWDDFDPIGEKDVFVIDDEAIHPDPNDPRKLGVGHFDRLPGVKPHLIETPSSCGVEYDDDTLLITRYAKTASNHSQHGIMVKIGAEATEDELGDTPWSLNLPQVFSLVDVYEIERNWAPAEAAAQIRSIIAHELGHACNLHHWHPGDSTDEHDPNYRPECVMIFPSRAGERPRDAYCTESPGHSHLYWLH